MPSPDSNHNPSKQDPNSTPKNLLPKNQILQIKPEINI
jgi:hypothetical protein